jgi:hypothetical protein
MDPDPDADPAIFVSDLQDNKHQQNQQKIYFYSAFAYYFLKIHLHHFSKMKS